MFVHWFFVCILCNHCAIIMRAALFGDACHESLAFTAHCWWTFLSLTGKWSNCAGCSVCDGTQQHHQMAIDWYQSGTTHQGVSSGWGQLTAHTIPPVSWLEIVQSGFAPAVLDSMNQPFGIFKQTNDQHAMPDLTYFKENNTKFTDCWKEPTTSQLESETELSKQESGRIS